MSIILALLLLIKIPALNQKAITPKEGYETISLGPVSGNYLDSKYLTAHRIPTSIFTPISNGDLDGYNVANAFDDNSKSFWVSKEEESSTFRPSITIDFKEPILFEGFLFDPVYRSTDSVRYFDGFPHKVRVYAALNDEPLELNAIFTGNPVDPWTRIQFILTKPVKCSQIKLEFSEISEATYFDGRTDKLAATEGIILLQVFEHDVIYYEAVNGKYDNSNYINFCKISNSKFDPDSTGDFDEKSKISNAFDDSVESTWISKDPESDTFHPSIFATFHGPVLFDAFTFVGKRHSNLGKKKLDGFPSSIKLYTALNDEPLKLNTVFIGSPNADSPKVQYVLSKPVKCTKIQLELHDVCNFEAKKGKYAATDEISFFQSPGADTVFYEKVSGNYDNSNYISFHKIPNSDFDPDSTGDFDENSKISNAFDDSVESTWISKDPESDTFHPSIFATFHEPVLFDAFTFVGKRHSSWSKQYLDGFPSSIKFYTALNDEPLKLNTVFIGSPNADSPKVQYVLSKPVKCTKIQLELHDVCNFDAKKGKYAATDEISFFQTMNENILSTGKATDNYADQNYIEYHKVPKRVIKFDSSGDRDGSPIDNAFDGNTDTLWISKDAQTDTFHPSITATFEKPVLLEAFLYDAETHKKNLNWYFDGFPNQVAVYTALNDEPLKLHSIFQGNPGKDNKRGQYVFPNSINCTKVQLVFYDISEYSSQRVAVTRGLTFLQSFIENPTRFEPATGSYTDSFYLSEHTIPSVSFTAVSNGDESGRDCHFMFTDNENEYWVSNSENTHDFHATVTITFQQPKTVEGFIIKATNGLPLRLNVHTALNDEPLTLNTEFAAIPADSWNLIQFVLPQPVKCTKFEIEFVQVTNKKATITQLTLLQELDYQYLNFGPVSGFLSNDHYVETHKIPNSDKNNYTSTGDKEGFPIKNAFDDDAGTHWVADREITNDFHPSIFIDFAKPIVLEAVILNAKICDEGRGNKFVVGFPTKLKLTASINNDHYSALFVGSPGTSVSKYQFVLPATVSCSRLQLEFLEVTEEREHSDKKRVALIQGVDVIAEEFPDFSQSDFTDDLSTIYVNKSYVSDQVSNANFIDVLLPKDDEYMFIVEKDFAFDNVSFKCSHNKLSAIKSQNASHVVIEQCHFVSCIVKNEKKNGGAINFINCAINCGKSDFINCSSQNGGGIYIHYDKSIKEKLRIEGCSFIKCSAAYGAGCYVYMNSYAARITISNCTFDRNKVRPSDDQKNQEYSSGTAIFMCARIGIVRKCKFTHNEGSNAFTVINNFDSEPETQSHGRLARLFNDQSVSISECIFDFGENAKSSLFYVGGNKGSKAELNNCVFTGVLKNGAHFVDGKTLNANAHKLLVRSCMFSADSRNSLKFDPSNNYLSVDLKSQHFNYNEFKEIKNSNASWMSFVSLVVPVAAVVIIVVAIVIVKLKKKSANDKNEEHEMSVDIHDSLFDQSLI